MNIYPLPAYKYHSGIPLFWHLTSSSHFRSASFSPSILLSLILQFYGIFSASFLLSLIVECYSLTFIIDHDQPFLSLQSREFDLFQITQFLNFNLHFIFYIRFYLVWDIFVILCLTYKNHLWCDLIHDDIRWFPFSLVY